MSFSNTIKTVLAADSTLVSYLPGGLYTWEDTKRLGFNRNNTPNAYSAGFLVPSLIVKSRKQTPQYNIPDDDFQFIDTKTMVEIWVYTDGDKSDTPLQQAQARVYTLLQGQRISGAFVCHLTDMMDETDVDPGNERAKFLRYEYVLDSNIG